jgi:hypothetical protein
MEKDENKSYKPSGWFFAEWISIIGTFIVCFVFLFYQNQVQSARSDKIYEQFQSAMTHQTMRSDRLYEVFYQVVSEKK